MAPRQSTTTLGPERFRAPESRPGTAGRSLLAGLALLLVIVGLPTLLLITLGPPPIPTDLSLSVLTRAVSVEALLGVLVPAVREFFVLAWPTPATWLVIAVVGGAAVVGIETVHLVRRRLAGSRARD